MGLLLLMGNSFSGALDTLGTGLESAWSVGRRLRTAYTGPIIRVRRSSDNAEQDFYGTGAGGAVSVSAVQAFCGAGDGFVTTIYGQAGNSRNLTQSTTTLQPQVVTSGTAKTIGGKLAATFDGSTSSRRMNVPSSESVFKFLHDGTASTVYGVVKVDDTAAEKTIFSTFNLATDVGARFTFLSDETVRVRVQGTSPNVPINVNKTGGFATNVFTLQLDADNASGASREEVWKDGVALATDNALTDAVSTANASRIFNLGTVVFNGGSFPFSGDFAELVIWSQDRTASRTVWESSAKQFWGTP